jgi:zinc transport system permease protein
VVGWVTLRGSEREDTVIGAVWAVGMAAGIVFIHATPGYHEDLMSYLFGNILLVSGGDLLLTAVLDAVVVGVILLSHDKLRAVCFDEEFARVRNVHVEGYFMLLLALTAVTVVLLAMMVGVVMVIALLTLPAAIAARAMGSLGAMMLAAAAIAIVFNLVGLTISYTPDLPAGATIILVAGVAYFLSILGGWLWQRRAARRGAEHAGGT